MMMTTVAAAVPMRHQNGYPTQPACPPSPAPTSDSKKMSELRSRKGPTSFHTTKEPSKSAQSQSSSPSHPTSNTPTTYALLSKDYYGVPGATMGDGLPPSTTTALPDQSTTTATASNLSSPPASSSSPSLSSSLSSSSSSSLRAAGRTGDTGGADGDAGGTSKSKSIDSQLPISSSAKALIFCTYLLGIIIGLIYEVIDWVTSSFATKTIPSTLRTTIKSTRRRRWRVERTGWGWWWRWSIVWTWLRLWLWLRRGRGGGTYRLSFDDEYIYYDEPVTMRMAPLTSTFEGFYTRRLYGRMQDCWNRPIKSAPTAGVGVLEREALDPLWHTRFKLTGKVLQCLNLASYNYLGFAASLVSGSSRHVSQQDNQLDQGRGVGCGDDDGQTKVSVAAIEGQCDAQDVSSTTATKTPSDNERCLLSAIETVRRFGVSASGSRTDAGTLAVHHKVEQMIAHFVGKEAAIVFNMGYATNSTCIPALVSEGDLIVSDSLNHASIVVGCRASGAKIKVFQHDNCVDLERILRRAILKGQSRTRRPYGKILIIVEGVYSMEGEICRLREIVALKRKYNCFLYVDEAHSIGAIGETGRGVCEHTGVDPADVDLLMGTFTKAFASVGGYIAANRDIVDHLRRTSSSYVYDTAMSPATAQQVISALEVLQTESGRARVASLRQNSILFRSELKARGFHVFGDESSPVVPVMLYYPCKMPAFSRASLQRRIAAVVVGYPATSFLSSRIRFCVSAAHSVSDLLWAIDQVDELGELQAFKYDNHTSSPSTINLNLLSNEDINNQTFCK